MKNPFIDIDYKPTEHVNHPKKGQNNIHYITGESSTAVSSFLPLESLRKKDLEVLYLADPVDEDAAQQFKEFDGKKLKSSTKEGPESDDEDEKKKPEERKAKFGPLTKLMKEVLGDKTEIKGAFLTFQRDVDQIYHGRKEKPEHPGDFRRHRRERAQH